MGWIRDLLKEVPLSTVLQERVELAEEKFAKVEAEAQSLRDRIVALERENAELRGRLPKQGTGVQMGVEYSSAYFAKRAGETRGIWPDTFR